jgi:DNA-binding CsgD family transcriptional regulator
MAERISDINRPVPERDPDYRRRLDAEAMRERDARIAKLLRSRVPFRVIAARLGMSVGSVQKAVARIRAGGLPPERTLPAPRHRSRFDTSAND